MLAEILAGAPKAGRSLVDQPGTVGAEQGRFFRRLRVEERAVRVGQSFFDPLPSGKDVYLLRGIINDWPDEEAITILKRCAEAAGRSGRVVILKGVTPDGTPKGLSIEVVLVGGKQRTVSEFRELAKRAGLDVVEAGRQDEYFVVECKVENQ